MSRSKNQLFLVDASAWIEAHEVRYPPAVFPSLWRLLKKAGEDEQIKSPRQAVRELGTERGGVGAWVRTIYPSIILSETKRVADNMARVVVEFPTLLHGVTTDAADPWLVAHALTMASPATIVTEESLSQNPAKPRLPNVCAHYRVPCVNTVVMFQRLGIKI